jgi:DNA-binding NtrC family response regulator
MDMNPRPDGRRLLIVDDDATMRDIVAAVAAMDGWPAVHASSGGEALRLLREAPTSFALVVTDVEMPGGGGLELMEAARRSGLRLPFVVMSGSPRWRGPASEKGALRFMVKPFRLSELRAALRMAVPPTAADGPATWPPAHTDGE